MATLSLDTFTQNGAEPYDPYEENAYTTLGSVSYSTIPNNRNATFTRRMMHWLVPERGIIEMYVNPQNLTIKQQKKINSERTKGGFVVQYWGEELISITISGTTGSSGIEGINVLNDVYRGEQIAFDVLAIEEAAKYQDESAKSWIDTFFPQIGDMTDILEELGGGDTGPNYTVPRPTFASYATGIELYWQGEIYRGFFTDFDVQENTSDLGLFNYTMNFKATQRRGYRLNYMPWHRSAMNGPSNSDAIPLSYGNTGFTFTSAGG